MTTVGTNESVSSALGTGQRYIYAVMDADHGLPDALPEGLSGAELEYIVDGPVAAVVSTVKGKKLRPRRAHLSAHHGVINALMAHHTVLPMSFGIVSDDPDDVVKFLGDHRDVLMERLEVVRGKLEMGLRVKVRAEDIFAWVVERAPELAATRDRYFADGREPNREEKIELGRQFQQALDNLRESTVERVSNHLRPASVELRSNEVRNENEFANLAALLPRDKVAEFEEAVSKAAEGFEDDFIFSLTGELAPYTFVDLQINS